MSSNCKLIKIGLDKLLPHPENPNRISKTNFDKLKRHIENSGRYEPLVVRRHPQAEGCFQIINGHHRAKVLQEIGEAFADCVVWDTDDDQTRILLATLNRLGGKDELGIKIDLIKKLSQKYETKELASWLPDSKQTIEKLKNISADLPLANNSCCDAFLNTMIFFLDDKQKKIVEKALAKASPNSSKASQKAEAITKIAYDWLNINEKNEKIPNTAPSRLRL